MKKHTKIIFFFCLAMTAVLTFLVFLNLGNLSEMKRFQRESLIRVTAYGTSVEYNMEHVRALPSAEFQAILRDSAAHLEANFYTGALLKDLLLAQGVDLNAVVSVSISGADGYAAAFDREEILRENGVYLVYARDMQLLGTRENGGTGPYQIIVREGDIFAQRWCKHVALIEVK